MAGERIAVVGGGINGAGIAWELVRRGYSVTLFEKGAFGSGTSSASTKLIHGGLRYLEQFRMKMVYEALHDRTFLLERLPDLVRPIELAIPIYPSTQRSAMKIGAGLRMYDALARDHDHLPPSRRVTRDEILAMAPLRSEGLRGGFTFFDAQTDDRALVVRVIEAAMRDGLDAREHTAVVAIERVGLKWRVVLSPKNVIEVDLVVLAVGPWMNHFLLSIGWPARHAMTLLRGSHLVLRRPMREGLGLFLESPHDQRPFFVLPWKGGTLVGTTEVVQEESPDFAKASNGEIDYLLTSFNAYVLPPAERSEITSTFAGVRPLVGRGADPNRITRESRIDLVDRAVYVYGGKLTTFMSLARETAAKVDEAFGRRTIAREPRF